MEFAVRSPRSGLVTPASAFHDVFRPGANDWAVIAGAFAASSVDHDTRVERMRTAIRGSAARGFRPSLVLRALGDGGHHNDPDQAEDLVSSIMVARLELDRCGAWVTLANAGDVRPFVIRQAGWIDVRGNVADPPGPAQLIAPADDRVGLGPGDALVVASEEILGAQGSGGDRYSEEALPEMLLASIDRPAAEVAARALAGALDFSGDRAPDDGLVIVVRVPCIERGRALERVANATGIPIEELDLPGDPGDIGLNVLDTPPNPPCEARINLRPEPLSVPALRRLLRRLLQSWRISAEGDLELLATEVATNAFAEASSPVTVIVRYDGAAIRVEIGDGARERPKRTLPGYDELTGSGLLLVEALSTDWGVMRTRAGKRIWFEVPAVRNGDT